MRGDGDLEGTNKGEGKGELEGRGDDGKGEGELDGDGDGELDAEGVSGVTGTSSETRVDPPRLISVWGENTLFPFPLGDMRGEDSGEERLGAWRCLGGRRRVRPGEDGVAAAAVAVMAETTAAGTGAGVGIVSLSLAFSFSSGLGGKCEVVPQGQYTSLRVAMIPEGAAYSHPSTCMEPLGLLRSLLSF